MRSKQAFKSSDTNVKQARDAFSWHVTRSASLAQPLQGDGQPTKSPRRSNYDIDHWDNEGSPSPSRFAEADGSSCMHRFNGQLDHHDSPEVIGASSSQVVPLPLEEREQHGDHYYLDQEVAVAHYACADQKELNDQNHQEPPTRLCMIPSSSA
ncbi:Mlo6p [Datura stramonium]|uniref:Mlo6p n=1 Tax=Datura stramonium TaxID=4076 RepID=A0ABS8RUB9_DATST|nr:Mlo6p [Datura stramonium]